MPNSILPQDRDGQNLFNLHSREHDDVIRAAVSEKA